MSVSNSSIVRRPFMLPADVVALDTSIFNIPHSIIKIMDLPDTEVGSECKVINVRHLGAKDDNPLSGRGFSIEEMTELRESIRDAGWIGLLVCRWSYDENGEAVIQLVAGERRWRSIHKLVAANELCRDRSKDDRDGAGNLIEGWTLATELYKTVRCEVLELSDEDALCLNFLENDKHAAIGEGAAIRFVKRMRAWGWDDERMILEVKKSKQWLFETDQLIQLDAKCFQAICEEKVNRTGGLLLTKIDDTDERQDVLDEAITKAWDRAHTLIAKRQDQYDKASNQENRVVAMLVGAEVDCDTDTVEKLRERLRIAELRTEKRRENLVDARGEATAKQRDVRHGIRTVRPRSARTSGNPALRPAKIQKYFVESIDQLISSDGKDNTGVKIVHEDHLYVAKAVVQGILTGKTDVIAILHKHFKSEHAETAA